METSLMWLRPSWLLGFLPLLLLALYWLRQRKDRSDWEALVDPELQRYVIEQSPPSKRRAPVILFLAWAFSLILLAGPVWQQQEVPVFQAEQAEVVLFDLSRSMLADDVAPDRLTRARFKLMDLLQRSDGRQTGLVAFAERPYIISPLTEDALTVEAFVSSLDPDIMPAQGSRLDLAISKALELLDQASVEQGHILAITDAVVTDRDRLVAREAKLLGHRVSVLAIGTPAGSPLRDEAGQFLQQKNGAIVVPQLDMPGMRSLANAGAGVAVMMTSNSDDLDTIEAVRQLIAISEETGESVAEKIYWIEYAPWGVWLLLLLLLGSFRRGIVS
ncbi:MAG: Ca-activated chloride channel family protein [Granulosicoccus sp.]|jgi:Ca-activated chloride channel family protein